MTKKERSEMKWNIIEMIAFDKATKEDIIAKYPMTDAEYERLIAKIKRK